MGKHFVLHPVQHGKLYGRGSIIHDLNEKDAATLVKHGSVKPIVVDEQLSEKSLDAAFDSLTKAELIERASEVFGLTLSLSMTKAELINEIKNAAALKGEA